MALTPRLRKLLTTGDPKQLLNFVADVPRTVLPYGFESTLTYLPKRRIALHTVVELWETYRFHPMITWLLSHTFYEGKLFTNIQEGDRPLLIDAPLYLPTPQVPLVFLHQVSDDERDDMSNSKHNPRHASDAAVILRHLWAHFLPEDPEKPHPLVCLCLYSAECRRLRKELRDLDMAIMTVDSYQANQRVIIYLLTTRSVKPEKADNVLLEFVHNPLRTNVSLSRARDGLFIHGDLTTLKSDHHWNTFFTLASSKGAIAVDPTEYRTQLEDPESPGAISCTPITF